MSVKRVGLVARITLPAAVSTLAEAAAWLDAHGCQPVLDTESAAAAPNLTFPSVAREALPEAVDVVIAFGGDGTLLDAAGIVAQSPADVPVLGVNLGRLGFLTEVNRTEMTGALAALVEGRTRTETRLMLSGRVNRAGGELVASHVGLNDIVVTRTSPSRMIEIEVAIDGQIVTNVKADGVIVASATGSTAYNLSAGGPIVHPSVDAFVLTPIAPHMLTQRPLVLPATAMMTIRPLADRYPADILVTFDGQYRLSLTDDDTVTVQRAPRLLKLIRTSPRTHYDMLREKLKWGG